MDVGKEDMDGAWDGIKRIMLQDAAEAHGVIKYEEGDLVEWWWKSGNGLKKRKGVWEDDVNEGERNILHNVYREKKTDTRNVVKKIMEQ